MSPTRLQWYWQRLRRMSADEVAHRIRDGFLRVTWRRRQVRAGHDVAPVPSAALRGGPVPLPPPAREAVPDSARVALVAAAEDILHGRWEILGVPRPDSAAPDWFLDPISGRRAPRLAYSFSIDHRSEGETGNVKQVWELSRHHHLTVLAAAWYVSGDDRHAEAVDRQLRDWWRQNPFLSGVHWTSGIELGIRLISWAWIRRLLDGWPGCRSLFEDNDDAVRQIYWHQQYLSTFRSTGSSANNHVIAEAAGQLVASCAFRWFSESDAWRMASAAALEDELERNTFASGINRELASDYHCLVAELGLVAAVEADAAGRPVEPRTWEVLGRMVDAAAAMVDEQLRPPRQGDGDDGRALLIDPPTENHWPSMLAAGASIFGPLRWWTPDAARQADLRSTLLAALAGDHRRQDGRPDARPAHFADAGFTLLRSTGSDAPEIWCRCDGGPHGYLSIAAHAHADALSIEVRHGGVDVLADPGTYCYHGEPEWRTYFRSTLGHNTLELDGRDQSRSGGPFLWASRAESRVVEVTVGCAEATQSWTAEHHGYQELDPPAVHRRTVTLDRSKRRLEVVDTVEGSGTPSCRLAFHLGPAVHAIMDGCVVALEWSGAGRRASATLNLPRELDWRIHRGEVGPPLGWYSPVFGRKLPTFTVVGSGTHPRTELTTTLQFHS